MTAIEFFIAGMSVTFGIITCIIILITCIIITMLLAVIIGIFLSILTYLIKERIYWEFPLSVLLISALYWLDTNGGSYAPHQTILLTGILFTAIITADTLSHLLSSLDRKIQLYLEKSEGDEVK